jgi:acetylglutamate kinase
MNVIVIKYGGSLLEEPGHRSAFLKDVADLFKKQKLILVHGGGKEISRQMEKAGLAPRFIDGRRFTDERALTVVLEALAALNREIVVELRKNGASADGYSGQIDHLLECGPIPGLGRVGKPRQVNAKALENILSQPVLPVFYPIGEDATRQPLNINADDFAQALAVGCRARRLVFLTDTGGVMDRQGRVISTILPEDVETLARKQIITGGMLVKARACVDALRQGVGFVDIVKGIRYLLEAAQAPADGTEFSLSGR